MPKVSQAINDVYATATRPIAFAAIRKIAAICGWDFSKEELIFRGKAVQPQPLADLEYLPNTVNNDVKGPGDGFLSIELQEQPEDQSSVYDTVFKRNALPVFLDKKLGISLVPSYATMTATLTITRRFADQPSAERWWYDMKRLITQEHGAAFIDADYSYIVPVKMLYVLREAHERREKIAGYGETFSEYLRNCFDERASTDTTRKGDNKSVRLVIREKQTEISGFFDFGDVPKPEKVDNAGTFDVNFSYRYTYEVPTHLVARYPVQVHQQTMPENLLNKPDISARDARQVRRGGMAVMYQDRMRSQFIPRMNRYETVFKYPDLDEWTPSIAADSALPATTLFTALLAVSTDAPKSLVAFEDLAEVGEFHPELQRWFKDHPDWMSTYYKSPLYLEVWKNDVTYNRESWHIDSHGDVVADAELDLRATYRVRLALLNDLSHLQPESLRAMCDYPALTTEILLALGSRKEDIPTPNGLGVLGYAPLVEAIRKLPKTAEWFRRKKDIVIPQVMIGTIIGVNRNVVK